MSCGDSLVAKELSKIDHLAGFFLPYQRKMTALRLDLHAHLGCQRNTSAYVQASECIRNEEMKGVRACDW